jgi:hypothetical protein
MYWKATYDTPLVYLTADNLSICGKSIMEDPYSFYQPIIKKIPGIQSAIFVVELDIKSINSVSKKQIYRILTMIKENNHIQYYKILWLNDPSDDDGHDLGKELESILGITFEYLEYA